MMSQMEAVDFAGKKFTKEEFEGRVQQLRTLILDDPSLQGIRTDETYLRRYLFSSEFNPQVAYQKIKEYKNLCSNNPKWFAQKTVSEFKPLLDTNFRLVVPLKDREGRRVMLSRCYNCDTKKINAELTAVFDEYMFEAVADEAEVQQNGVAMIMDMKGYSMKMFGWMTPGNMKIGAAKTDLFPCKELVYHIINSSRLVNAGMKLLWPFLSSKLKEKMVFHYDDMSSLHKHISPDVLPPEYGGTGPEIDNEKCIQFMLNQEEAIAKSLIFNQIH